jgi:LacI family transcriptional regulator
MRQVAERAGVSIKTVSRVINGEPAVAPATLRRVLSAAAALDYQPDPHAGNLRRADRRTRTLGLLVSSVDNPFAGAIHRAIEDVAHARGVAVFASSLDDDPEREPEAVAAFLRRRVDGLVLTTSTPEQTYLEPELRRGTPVVFVDRKPTGVACDAVVSDNAAGAALATRHLLVRGHRRVAFLGDRAGIQTAAERRHGFLETLAEHRIPVAEAVVVEGLHDETLARDALLRILDGPEPPTAVFSAQNLITVGALRALRERGRHRDTALIGFDDVELADLMDPGVSVIAQHPENIGRIAAERLFARLDGDDSPAQHVTVGTTLVERGSGEIPPPP